MAAIRGGNHDRYKFEESRFTAGGYLFPEWTIQNHKGNSKIGENNIMIKMLMGHLNPIGTVYSLSKLAEYNLLASFYYII